MLDILCKLDLPLQEPNSRKFSFTSVLLPLGFWSRPFALEPCGTLNGRPSSLPNQQVGSLTLSLKARSLLLHVISCASLLLSLFNSGKKATLRNNSNLSLCVSAQGYLLLICIPLELVLLPRAVRQCKSSRHRPFALIHICSGSPISSIDFRFLRAIFDFLGFVHRVQQPLTTLTCNKPGSPVLHIL